MARAPNEKVEQAKSMYQKGTKLVDIAKQLNVPEGTVRRWKSTYEWESERSDKNSERSERKKSSKRQPVAEEVEQVIENPELTDKQRLFCVLYIKYFNATKAYQKAYGCSYETAMVEGSRTLRNPKIKKEIQKLKQNRLNQEIFTVHDLFQQYLDIARADIKDFLEFGQEEVQVMAMYGPVFITDPDTGEKKPLTKKVNVIRFKQSADVDGTLISEVKQGKDGASIKLADRMKALEWLSEHMDFATEKQKAEIALLKARTDKLTGNNAEIEDLGDIEGEIYGI